MNKWQFFPYKIFLKTFFTQLLFYIVLAVLMVLFLKEHYGHGWDFFWTGTFNFIFLFFLMALVLSYFWVAPIWRLILKIYTLTHKTVAESEDDLLYEEFGEFANIEIALNKWAKKFKKKKEQLVREREENQAFMSSVAEGLVSLSQDEKLLYFNSQFAAQFVLPEILKLSKDLYLKDIFREPEVMESFRLALKKGQTCRLTVRLKTLIDNNPRFFAISVAALRKNKSSEVYGAIGIFHDITELKKAEQVRIDFVGNASHELRTPLTSLKGYVETLKEDFKAQNFSHFENFLQILSKNVDRLIDLVNDLLTISTLESHADLKLDNIAPLALTENIVNELQSLAFEKKQRIQISCSVQSIKADTRKIEQVLRNLISNAIKYIPEGKHIHVFWELSTEGHTVLKVKDNGPGIPKEHHDRLFERFYRIDKGRARDAGGTGLGLSIVKHIVQSHKGTVKVISDPAVGGAEFICTFPQR